MKKVFLGGTCNNSTWREDLMPLLDIDFFNPAVPDWTEACYQEELTQRANCDFVLYCITPRMTGAYSIAEVVDDSNKRPEKTVFAFTSSDGELVFDKGQIKSLGKVAEMVKSNGGTVFADAPLAEIAQYLNTN